MPNYSKQANRTIEIVDLFCFHGSNSHSNLKRLININVKDSNINIYITFQQSSSLHMPYLEYTEGARQNFLSCAREKMIII